MDALRLFERAARPSFLGKRHAASKLLAYAACCVGASSSSLELLGVWALLGAIASVASGQGFRDAFHALRILLPFTLSYFLLSAFSLETLSFVDAADLRLAALRASRLAVLGWFSLSLFASTRMSELSAFLGAAQRIILRGSAFDPALLLSATAARIPATARVYADARDAIIARGGGKKGMSFRLMFKTLIGTISRALIDGQEFAEALIARSYTPARRPVPRRLSVADAAPVLLCAGMAIGTIVVSSRP